MNQRNKMLLALGAIALGSAGLPTAAAAQDTDADYRKVCDWLSGQSRSELQTFIKQNPNDPCAEVAAQLLAERSQPEAGVRRPPGAFGRY